MKLLLTCAKSFHRTDGRRGAPGSIVTLAAGQVTAPEWIRETNTYRAGVADGSIRDFAPAGTSVFIPTRNQLLEKGYAPEVADEIIVRQRELEAKFTPPASEEDEDEPAEQKQAFLPGLEPANLGLDGQSGFGNGTTEPAPSKGGRKKKVG